MVKKLVHNGAEVLIVDYSNCSGDKMIEFFEQARTLVLSGNIPVVVLSIFNNKTYVSTAFIRHVEKFLPEVEKLIDRQAIIGLSTIQEWILKGVNLWYRKRIHNFSTEGEALTFLTQA